MKKIFLIIILSFLTIDCYAENYIFKNNSAYSLTPTLDGLYIKLNNSSAFNSYVWPNADGSSNQRLTTNGSGTLSWATVSGGSSTDTLDDVVERGAVTDKIITTAGLGVGTGTVSGSTVSGNTVRTGSYAFPLGGPTDNQIIKYDAGSGTLGWEADAGGGGGNGSIGFAFINPVTNSSAWVRSPYAGTITDWEITSYLTGSTVVGIWKSTYASFPPTASNSIAGTEKPTLTSQNRNTDTSLGTWTTGLSAGDYVWANIDSMGKTVTQLTVSIQVTKD